MPGRCSISEAIPRCVSRAQSRELLPSPSEWSRIAPDRPSCSARIMAWCSVFVVVNAAPVDFKLLSDVHDDKGLILNDED